MRFDLVDLSLFCHVAEAGSITAPNRAHLALAAASTRIRHMEETLGAPLLVRGRQGVTPTQAGRTLLRSLGWQERPLWVDREAQLHCREPLHLPLTIKHSSDYVIVADIEVTRKGAPNDLL